MLGPIPQERGATGNTRLVLPLDMRQRRPRNFTDNLPNGLRRARLAAGLSLPAAAQLVGLDDESLRKRETGQVRLPAIEIDRFAKAYGCTEAEILGRAPELTHQEAAILEMFRALPEDKKATLYRLGAALVEPSGAEVKPEQARRERA